MSSEYLLGRISTENYIKRLEELFTIASLKELQKSGRLSPETIPPKTTEALIKALREGVVVFLPRVEVIFEYENGTVKISGLNMGGRNLLKELGLTENDIVAHIQGYININIFGTKYQSFTFKDRLYAYYDSNKNKIFLAREETSLRNLIEGYVPRTLRITKYLGELGISPKMRKTRERRRRVLEKTLETIGKNVSVASREATEKVRKILETF